MPPLKIRPKPLTRKSDHLKVGTLVPWAGGNRMAAEEVGRAMDGKPYAAVVFAGGMSEIPCMRATTIVVNDLHKHVINLARVVADPTLGPRLYRCARRKSLHVDELRESQEAARGWDGKGLSFDAALSYFVSQWMGRNGASGGPGEFKSPLSVRWKSGGGDSAVRYASAVRGISAWRKILGRCTFHSLDWRVFLSRVKDDPKTAIYADPPWPGLGDEMYSHKFTEGDHRSLAERLGQFQRARIVLRYLDCPLAVELYRQRDRWSWKRYANRNRGNNPVAEVLIVKNGG